MFTLVFLLPNLLQNKGMTELDIRAFFLFIMPN